MSEWGIRRTREGVSTWRGVEIANGKVRGGCAGFAIADSAEETTRLLVEAYAEEHAAFRSDVHTADLTIKAQQRAAARSQAGVSERKADAARKREEARRLAAELRQRHPTKAASWLANEVYKTAPELGSVRTIRRFIRGI
jgi:hypothetical protein